VAIAQIKGESLLHFWQKQSSDPSKGDDDPDGNN
jgi:hypothetical protein